MARNPFTNPNSKHSLFRDMAEKEEARKRSKGMNPEDEALSGLENSLKRLARDAEPGFGSFDSFAEMFRKRMEVDKAMFEQMGKGMGVGFPVEGVRTGRMTREVKGGWNSEHADIRDMFDMGDKPKDEAKVEKPVTVATLKKRTSKTLDKLNAMNGMSEIKHVINEIVSFVTVAKQRKNMGLKADSHNIHMVFKGSPGTGKTTVARMIGKIFSELGVIDKPDGAYSTDGYGSRRLKHDWEVPFTEVDNSHIAHPHVGVGERIMREKVEEAQGGVLFIDEAYSMVGHSHHKSDDKVIATLVKGMEDYAGKFVCIFAGYEDEMQEFLDFNTGLRSRVPFQVNFPDFTTDELIGIAQVMCDEKEYRMDDKFVEGLKLVLEIEKQADHFGNGRTVRNIMEKAIRNQSIRLFENEGDELTRDELMRLQVEDLQEQMKESKQRVKEQKESQTSQRRGFIKTLTDKMKGEGLPAEV